NRALGAKLLAHNLPQNFPGGVSVVGACPPTETFLYFFDSLREFLFAVSSSLKWLFCPVWYRPAAARLRPKHTRRRPAPQPPAARRPGWPPAPPESPGRTAAQTQLGAVRGRYRTKRRCSRWRTGCGQPAAPV